MVEAPWWGERAARRRFRRLAVTLELRLDYSGVMIPQSEIQNVLCLTSAPWEPSASIVSFTWKPRFVGSPTNTPVRSIGAEASRSVPPRAARSVDHESLC